MPASPLFRLRTYTLAVALVAVTAGVAWGTRGSRAFPVPGVPAPSFTATTLTGDTVTLEDYRGQVVLVNIWATWCAPCREEMPSMQRLYEDFTSRDEPFTILAVSVDAPPGQRDAGGNLGGDLKAFADELGLTFPILHDPAGAIQRIYYTTGVPESFVVDREGIIRSRIAGATEWDAPQRKAAIAALLPERAASDSVHLLNSHPASDEVLPVSPQSIPIRLSEVPMEGTTSIRVVDERGHVIPTRPIVQVEGEPAVFETELNEPLPPAPYTVVWRATGQDGRAVRALFGFVIAPSP
ncbi:MAG: redoxin domain-containing protein [Gemmatimonadota bacterium]|nr:redoxin domain-containing protein [Gemmatimonadota bacterium]